MTGTWGRLPPAQAGSPSSWAGGPGRRAPASRGPEGQQRRPRGQACGSGDGARLGGWPGRGALIALPFDRGARGGAAGGQRAGERCGECHPNADAVGRAPVARTPGGHTDALPPSRLVPRSLGEPVAGSCVAASEPRGAGPVPRLSAGEALAVTRWRPRTLQRPLLSHQNPSRPGPRAEAAGAGAGAASVCEGPREARAREGPRSRATAELALGAATGWPRALPPPSPFEQPPNVATTNPAPSTTPLRAGVDACGSRV